MAFNFCISYFPVQVCSQMAKPGRWQIFHRVRNSSLIHLINEHACLTSARLFFRGCCVLIWPSRRQILSTSSLPHNSQSPLIIVMPWHFRLSALYFSARKLIFSSFCHHDLFRIFFWHKIALVFFGSIVFLPSIAVKMYYYYIGNSARPDQIISLPS